MSQLYKPANTVLINRQVVTAVALRLLVRYLSLINETMQ